MFWLIFYIIMFFIAWVLAEAVYVKAGIENNEFDYCPTSLLAAFWPITLVVVFFSYIGDFVTYLGKKIANVN